MQWLNYLIGEGLNLVGIDTASRFGSSIQFFIYDVIKIFILLSVLIFLISYIQSFFPPERTKKIIGRFKGIYANTLAALLGTVTPFCSCSSIPLFKTSKSSSVKTKECCGGNCNQLSMKEAKEKQNKGNRVKILGSGCAKCNMLERNVVEALRQLGENTEVDHVTDFAVIASYGVMTTPAVVVDGRVVSYGKVLKVEEAINLLKKVL